MNQPTNQHKTGCPSRDDLQALLGGALDTSIEQFIESHVSTCELCGQTLEELCHNDDAVRWQQLAGTSGTSLSKIVRPQAASAASQQEVDLEQAPRIDGYEILSIAGTGGMGIVYKARQQSLKRDVAIKMLHSTAPDDLQRLARFKNEADSIASIQHPNVISIYEIAQQKNGAPYIVLEYINGPNLAQLIKESAPFDNFSAAQLVKKLAMAVDAAHQSNLIHRDLKPANILMQVTEGTELSGIELNDCEPKITDFGLAKSFEYDNKTQTSMLVGTPTYMAPEQITCPEDWAKPPVDVYALGIILYELLTGHVPFASKSTFELFKKIENEEPQPIRISNRSAAKDLEAITLKCLEKSSESRYQNTRQLADDLDRYMRRMPVSARRPTIVTRLKKWAVRNRVAVATGTILITLIACVAILGTNVANRRSQASAEFNDYIAQARSHFESAKQSEPRDFSDWESAEQALQNAKTTLIQNSSLLDSSPLNELADAIDLHWGARILLKEIDDHQFQHQFKSIDTDELHSRYQQSFQNFGISSGTKVSDQVARLAKLDEKSLEAVLVSLNWYLLSKQDFVDRTWFEDLTSQLETSHWRASMYQAIVTDDKTTASDLIDNPDLNISGVSLYSFAPYCNLKMGVPTEDIIDYMRKCHLRYPSSFWLNYGLSYFIRSNSHPKNSLEFIRSAVTQRDNPLSRMRLAETYIDMKMYDDAISELEEILNQHPEFGGAYKNLASCYRRKKIFGKAIDYFKLSMEYEPNADLIKGHLLDTYLEAGQAQTAKTFANELIARQSQDHETYHSKAIAYSRLGNYSKAIDFYELALEEDATCLFCLLDLSEALKQKGDLQAAIKPLQKFRTFLPTSIMALERLIDLHVELEQFDKAIEYAMLRINVSPTTNRFHSDLGDIYLKTGELQLAEGAFLKAQSLSSNNNIYSLIQLFKIYQQQDKLESAESALRRAVFINTTSVSAHHNLVKFLMSVQRHDEARSAAKEFLKRCPQSIWAQHWNVETLAAIGDADGAMQAFEQGLAADKIPPRMFTPTRKIELEKKLK